MLVSAGPSSPMLPTKMSINNASTPIREALWNRDCDFIGLGLLQSMISILFYASGEAF